MIRFGQKLLIKQEPGQWTIDPKLKGTLLQAEIKGAERAARLFSWIESYLHIRTKKGELRRINFNTIQELLAQYVAYCWAVGISIRVINPKGRQMGTSTFWQALTMALCELRKGYRAVLVAHNEAGATDIFGKAKTFYREMEESWPIYLVAEQRNRMDWFSGSSLSAATIKTGDGLGKGGSINAIHFSESANFMDKGLDAVGAEVSITASMDKGPMSMVIHESTAKGRDPYYYAKCERSLRGESEFQLIFLPWFLEKGYSMTWEEFRLGHTKRGRPDPGSRFQPKKDEKALRLLLANQTVAEHQVFYRYNYELTDEQLIWRRWAIGSICKGKLDLFQRYYPSTYEEAFTASTNCMFSEDTLEFYRGLNKIAPHTGMLVEKPDYKGPPRLGYDFREMRREASPLKIWEMPVESERYVVGADPGGANVHSDPNCAYVLKKRDMRVVACVYGTMDWEKFSDLVEATSVFYNEALLAVENNLNRAICSRLHSRGRANLYYYQDFNVLRIGKEKTPGFNTNARTRPEILSILEEACRKKAVYCSDPGFVREMMTFVWIPKKNSATDGRYMAVGTNKDDRIMAMAIAVYLCPRADWSHNPISPSDFVESKNTRAYARFLELEKDSRNRGTQSPLNLM